MKALFSVVGGLAAVAAILAVAIVLGLGTEPGRAHLEAVLATMLNMDVQIGAPVQVGYSRGLIVTLGDLQISNRERNVAAARVAEIGVEVMPLLYGQLRLRSVTLRRPVITIERTSVGAPTAVRPDTEGGAARTISVGRLAMTGGLLRYADARSGPILEGRVCDLDLHNVELGAGTEQDFRKHLTFAGHVACGEVESGAFTASGLELAVDASADVWVAELLTMNLFGGQGSGTIRVDLSHAAPRHTVRYTLAQFRVDEFFRTLSPYEVVAGAMTFTADLSARGHTFGEVRRSLEGTFGLRGEGLRLHGTDIDRTFSDVAHGVAEAQDVAMATNENRVALLGRLDLVNEEFVGVRVALVDSAGCAVAVQKIHGTFQNPVVEQPNVLQTLIGPARELLSRGRELIAGDDCETFYAGTVPPPG